MLLAGRLLPVARPFPRIRDAQRRGQHQHLAHATLGLGRQDHPAQPGVDRQPGEPTAPLGDRALPVERAELGQQLHTVADAAPVRRVEERKVLDIAQPQRRHLQQHRGEVGAQDLGFGVARAGREIGLGVQPDAHAGRDAAAAAGPLRGRRLRDRLDRQPLHLQPAAVARDAGVSRVDDVADAGHGQRRLGDVGRQHHPPAGVGREHLLLLGGGQPGVQRKHLGVLQRRQSLCGVPDFAFPGQKHQHVPGRLGLELCDRVDDRLDLVACFGAHDLVVGVVGIVRGCGGRGDLERPVADLHRVRASRHFDDGRVGEVFREPPRLDRRRGDDELQIRPTGQQLAQVAQQKIDVQAALVRLVEDQRVVAQQAAVALDLGEQDAVGHQLDQGAVAHLVGEPDGVADRPAQRAAQLVGDALRDGARGEPARLGVSDGSADAPAGLEADLGQLGGLARSGLPGDHHHLMRAYCVGDLPAPLADRQIGIADGRDGGVAGGDDRFRGGDLIGQLAQLVGRGAAQLLQPPAEARGVANGQTVKPAAQLRPGHREGRFGHCCHDRRPSATAAHGRPVTRRGRRGVKMAMPHVAIPGGDEEI